MGMELGIGSDTASTESNVSNNLLTSVSDMRIQSRYDALLLPTTANCAYIHEYAVLLNQYVADSTKQA